MKSSERRPAPDEERAIAESYRVRAEEIRAIAEMDRHMETRDILLRVAVDYEKMAVTMDHIADTNEVLRRT
jgi:hypothetical protein